MKRMNFAMRDRLISVIEDRATIVFLFVCCSVFFCMDLILFQRFLELPPIGRTPPNDTKVNGEFIPFADLSIKMMMTDDVNQYIHFTFAILFNKMTDFSTTFYFISPNFISFCGFLVALAASKCILSENLTLHRVAVFFLQLRCWFDGLDGVVARARMGNVKNGPIRFTIGYAVDGIADTAAYTVFMVCSYVYLKRFLLKRISPMKELSPKSSIRYSTPSKIFKVCFMFGLQLIISGILWNRYIVEYGDLLQTPLANDNLAIAQNEMLKSPITLLIIGMWRFCNSHALMQIYMVALFLHKQWNFHLSIQHIGFVVFAIAFITSEIHLCYMRNYIDNASPKAK